MSQLLKQAIFWRREAKKISDGCLQIWAKMRRASASICETNGKLWDNLRQANSGVEPRSEDSESSVIAITLLRLFRWSQKCDSIDVLFMFIKFLFVYNNFLRVLAVKYDSYVMQSSSPSQHYLFAPYCLIFCINCEFWCSKQPAVAVYKARLLFVKRGCFRLWMRMGKYYWRKKRRYNSRFRSSVGRAYGC